MPSAFLYVNWVIISAKTDGLDFSLLVFVTPDKIEALINCEIAHKKRNKGQVKKYEKSMDPEIWNFGPTIVGLTCPWYHVPDLWL